jgi:hypothetical protein
MKLLLSASTLAILSIPCLPAAAQDSTSNSNGLPGDPVDPHLAAEQVNDYVVDQSAFRSSWGRVYGIAPLVKASASYLPAPTYFSAQLSAQAISTETRVGVPFARASYDFWDVGGAGVNDDTSVQDPPTGSIDTSTAVGNQFAVTFAEYSSDDPLNPTISFNNVVTGVVNYDVDATSRLYVSRVETAVNSPDWSCNLSQFGMGGVDSDGMTHIRADGFGSGPCMSFTELLGNNYFQIDALGRNPGATNLITNAGASDAGATNWLLIGSSTTHTTPTIIGSNLTGGVPILIGGNFSGQYVYGSAAPLTSTNLHLGGASDHRGLVSHYQGNFNAQFPGSVIGTGAILGQTSGTTDRMCVWGLNASGAPSGTINAQLPSVVTDNDDGWATNSLGTGQLVFGHYFSQTSYRGGNGLVGTCVDQGGNLIAAAVALHPQFDNPDQGNNFIAVARVAPGGAMTWTVAAYTEVSPGSPGGGKALHDAGGATVIGQLIDMGTLTGGAPVGPSLTAPMLDSVGNIYFLSPLEVFGDGMAVGLVRAVYDRANFSYKLELIFRTGDEFHGQNSDTDYQLRYITIADSNSIDSGAAFSGNINQGAHNAADPGTLPEDSSEVLGGLVVSASVIYDVNDDGVYQTLTDDPATPDQQYNVLLYVSHAKDCNENGVPDDLDLLNGTSADNDGDGVPDECNAGTSFCFGDGSGASCPCGNFGGSQQGCGNSTGQGAFAFSTGSNSVVADDLGFDAFNMVPTQPALLFSGDNAVNGGAGVPFGDGLRCAGMNVKRLGVRVPDATGFAHWGPGLAASGAWNPGDTKHFQTWYRDPSGSPCGSGFNLSHGISVFFVP